MPKTQCKHLLYSMNNIRRTYPKSINFQNKILANQTSLKSAFRIHLHLWGCDSMKRLEENLNQIKKWNYAWRSQIDHWLTKLFVFFYSWNDLIFLELVELRCFFMVQRKSKRCWQSGCSKFSRWTSLQQQQPHPILVGWRGGERYWRLDRRTPTQKNPTDFSLHFSWLYND